MNWRALAVGLSVLAVAASAARADEVTVQRKGSRIVVTGGGGSDSVTIDSVANGQIRVAGTDGGTTVTGGEVSVGARDVVQILLKGGSNVVRVTGALPPFKNLQVVGDNGNDRLELDGAQLSGGVSFTGGNGQNVIVATGARVGGKVMMFGGFDVDAFTATDSTFEKNVSVDLADSTTGDVDLTGTEFLLPCVFRAGDGNGSHEMKACTFRRTLRFDCGAGNDVLAAEDTLFEGPATLLGGGGDDVVSAVDGSTARKLLKIDGGADLDSVRTGGPGFSADGPVKLAGGSGDDTLTVSAGTYAAPVAVAGGSGNDLLGADEESPPTFQHNLLLDGGSGDDVLSGRQHAVTADGRKVTIKSLEEDQ